MKAFSQRIIEAHQQKKKLPTLELTKRFLKGIQSLLFPSYSTKQYTQETQVEAHLKALEDELNLLLALTMDYDQATHISSRFFKDLEILYNCMLDDAQAIEKGDPAAASIEEVIASYPGFLAISIYRIAHYLHQQKVPLIPRMMSEYAHMKTGIDIHPGANIGKDFVIDHGTGIVIGETCTIGNRVKIYQGVTLGALSVRKSLASKKRHPTIEDDVVIYAGATILGGETVIGKNSTIGGNVWLTESVDANSLVYHQAEMTIQKRSE